MLKRANRVCLHCDHQTNMGSPGIHSCMHSDAAGLARDLSGRSSSSMGGCPHTVTLFESLVFDRFPTPVHTRRKAPPGSMVNCCRNTIHRNILSHAASYPACLMRPDIAQSCAGWTGRRWPARPKTGSTHDGSIPVVGVCRPRWLRCRTIQHLVA